MSDSLRSFISSERPERIAHDRSFPLSDLSDSVTVAHLSWAIWAIHSQLLIWFERNEEMSEWANEGWANEQMRDERMSEFPALPCRMKWLLFFLFLFLSIKSYRIGKKINGKWQHRRLEWCRKRENYMNCRVLRNGQIWDFYTHLSSSWLLGHSKHLDGGPFKSWSGCCVAKTI